MTIKRKYLPPHPECQYCSAGWLRVHPDYIRVSEKTEPCLVGDLVHIDPASRTFETRPA